MILLADSMQWLGLGCGALMLMWVVFRRRLSMLRRFYEPADSTPAARIRPSSGGPVHLPADPTVGLMDAPATVVRWEVGMHELARELRAELDCKMAAMQSLIVQAHEESNRLTAVIERAERLGIAPVKDTMQAIAQLGESCPPVVAEIERRLAAMAPDVGQPQGFNQELAEKIYALADEGRNARMIAQQLRAPIGDIEFALGLRSPTSSAGGSKT